MRVINNKDKNSALNTQVQGTHYKGMGIQPIEYILANNLTYIEGCIVKYISRHRDKGKEQDIRKIIHYCELMLELEYDADKQTSPYHSDYEPT